MKHLDELRNTVTSEKTIIAIARAAEVDILSVVKEALKKSYCSFVLFDNKEKIKETAQTVDLDLSQACLEIQDCDRMPEVEAVKSISQGRAHILMKGGLPTKSLLKAVLNKEYGLRSDSVLSHVALFEIPNQDRLIFLTDAAMNINPTLNDKTNIIKNTVEVARNIGVDMPKVAALAPVEVVNEAMPSTMDAAVLTQMSRRNQIKNCIVDGPLAFDVSISSKALQQKYITSSVEGNADILLAHNIEVANALYKSFVYFANAKVASIISGATAPIILTSRADSSENKMYSLLLALNASK